MGSEISVSWMVQLTTLSFAAVATRVRCCGADERDHYEAHSAPEYGRAGKDLSLAQGLVIANESMFDLGTAETVTFGDDWTVVNGRHRASVRVSASWRRRRDHSEGPKVLTAGENGRSFLASLV